MTAASHGSILAGLEQTDTEVLISRLLQQKDCLVACLEQNISQVTLQVIPQVRCSFYWTGVHQAAGFQQTTANMSFQREEDVEITPITT